MKRQRTALRLGSGSVTCLSVMLLCAGLTSVHAADRGTGLTQRLEGFDAYVAQALKQWHCVGLGVAIVVDGKPVFMKGYGYRDFGKKLPFTPATLIPLGSNTKLFTAVAAGMLVEQGALAWDQPIRDAVTQIRFSTDELNDAVTLRDMLSHRTGIARRDSIWYNTGITMPELFDRIRYLEPAMPLRQGFLYNNIMYAGVGRIIELKSGSSWKNFVHDKILEPLEMRATIFSVPEMERLPDHGVPYSEHRDSSELYAAPFYEDQDGVAPAGAIISNLEDTSHWLVALMGNGEYSGKQVLPARVLEETLKPAMATPNENLERYGWSELLNQTYGMGRYSGVYRGHLLASHGGNIGGFLTQISYMPQEHIGVIVFEIGGHSGPLIDVVSYNIYERLLDLSQTPWSNRWHEIMQKFKTVGVQARAKAAERQIPNTTPAHALSSYEGEYENPAYGAMTVEMRDEQLRVAFYKKQWPLKHYHYERFDTPDIEDVGKLSINFGTSPAGDVDRAIVSIDDGEVVFLRHAR